MLELIKFLFLGHIHKEKIIAESMDKAHIKVYYTQCQICGRPERWQF